MSAEDESPSRGHVDISVTSLFGRATHQPMVDVLFADRDRPEPTRYQISPQEARRVALLLLEGAEAAEQDANVWRFFTGLGLPEGQVVAALREFRVLRQVREKLDDTNTGEDAAHDPA